MTNEQGQQQAEGEALRAMVERSGSVAVQRMAERVNEITLREQAFAGQMAKLLQGTGAQWLKDATATQVLVFARAATYMGLNPLVGECYLLHGGFYTSVAGRLKLATRTGQFEGVSAPRMLSEAEHEVHGVKPGDVARLVELWRTGWRMPATGVGIVRAQEIDAARKTTDRNTGLAYMPIGRYPEMMAAKRATVAALKLAFPDLDVAVADLEDRGVRGYEVTVIDAAPPIAAPAPPIERYSYEAERGAAADRVQQMMASAPAGPMPPAGTDYRMDSREALTEPSAAPEPQQPVELAPPPEPPSAHDDDVADAYLLAAEEAPFADVPPDLVRATIERVHGLPWPQGREYGAVEVLGPVDEWVAVWEAKAPDAAEHIGRAVVDRLNLGHAFADAVRAVHTARARAGLEFSAALADPTPAAQPPTEPTGTGRGGGRRGAPQQRMV